MSQYSVEQTLGNASAIAVSPINADATLSVGSTLNSILWAGVGVFARGKPYTLLAITKSNFLTVLGDPIKPSAGSQFEPIRHVYEAVQQTSGYVVRVVPADAKFPIMYFTEEGAHTLSALAYGNDVELDSSAAYAIYVDDGDPCDSTTRAISLTAATADAGGNARFNLKLTQTTSLGVTSTLETHTVSLSKDAVDDMGRLCFLPDALEARSSYLAASVNDDLIDEAKFIAMAATTFTGGTNGTQSTITSDEYASAITVLNNANKQYTAVLGLGCYDPASIVSLADICTDRLIDGFFDVKPTLTNAEALTAVQNSGLLGVNYVSCNFYHFPYTCKDKWTQSRVTFGLSGTAYAAKAIGVKKNSDVGGWHYSPAGEERGIINRSSIKPLYPSDVIDEEAMVTSRLNKVAVGSTGQMVIDDALTCCSANNYLRFQHIPSLMNAISRYFVQLGRQIKHSPDGVTEKALTRGMTKVLDRFVAAGALRTPRDTDSDGKEPYVLKVEQVEIDLWKVTWMACPTGSARRILGEPVLIK